MNTIYNLRSSIVRIAVALVCGLVLPASAAAHTLTVSVNPTESKKTTSLSSGDFAAGQQVTINAYNDGIADFRFDSWTCGGEVVATTPALVYTMPDHDVELVANYRFDPNSPADPDDNGERSYWFYTHVLPEGCSGTTTNPARYMREGYNVTTKAYNSGDYKFKEWLLDGEVYTTEPAFDYIMPNHQVDFTAVFEYSPDNPSVNPGGNVWDPVSGRLVISDINGSVYDAIYSTISNLDLPRVREIVVVGDIMEQFSPLASSYFSNIQTLDLSRTWGSPRVLTRAFQGSKATTIMLPATTGTIGSQAFNNCENLRHIYVYATVPPEVPEDVFDGIANAFDIYVPMESVPLYLDHPVWGLFPIIGTDKSAHSINLTLPEDAADGRYRGFRLELVNKLSSERTPHIITDRLAYSFSNLLEGEQYALFLYTPDGLLCGRIPSIVIGNSDQEVTFDDIANLVTVYGLVRTPDGKNMTGNFSIEWYEPRPDGSSRLLSIGSEYEKVPCGQKLMCRMKLNGRTMVEYFSPNDTIVAVPADAGNTFVMTKVLDKRGEVTISGRVLDHTGSPLRVVSILGSAMLDGKTGHTTSATADSQGYFSMKTYEAPEYRVSIQSLDYISINDTIRSLSYKPTIDLGDCKLYPITGGRVKCSFTYTAPVAPGETPVTKDSYPYEQRLGYTAYNVTKGRPIANISRQYPNIVLLDESLAPGDKVRLTATDPNGTFTPVVTEITLDAKCNGEATFAIMARGAVEAKIEMTDNLAAAGQLYDAAGRLVASNTYSDAVVRFDDLEKGSYKLLTIGKTDLLTGVQTLAAFEEMGMKAGEDYVLSDVNVDDGVVTLVNLPLVPLLDENRFLYTDPSTALTVNKAEVVLGSYVTERIALAFKDKFAGDISNISLVYEFPEGCQFVENSVRRGNRLIGYQYNKQRLEVPIDASNPVNTPVWVVYVPTKVGECRVATYVRFDYGGRTILQPLGDGFCMCKSYDISVPDKVSTPFFFVSGAGPVNANVKVLDGRTIIGETTVDGAGLWSAKCELTNEPYSDLHKVQAVITTEDGRQLESEVFDVVKDDSAIEPRRVTMLSVDYRGVEQRVVFDYQNPSAVKNSYDYTPNKPRFNFLIEFSDPNPDLVKACDLYVYTSAGNTYILEAKYDRSMGCWTASTNFRKSNDLPVNVNVAALYNTVPVVDLGDAAQVTNATMQQANDLYSFVQNVDYYQSVIDAIDPHSPTALEDLRDAVQAWAYALGRSEDLEADFDLMTIEEYENGLEAFLAKFTNQDDLDEWYQALPVYSEYGTYDIGGSVLTRQPLSSMNVNYTAWTKYTANDGRIIYRNEADDRVEIAMPDDNLYCCRVYPVVPSNGPMKDTQFEAMAAKAVDVSNTVMGLTSKFAEITDKVKECANAIAKIKADQQFYALINNKAHFDWLKAHGQAAEVEKIINGVKKGTAEIAKLEKKMKIFKFIQTAAPFVSAINFLISTKQDYDDLMALYKSVPEKCELEQERADQVRNHIYNHGMKVAAYTIANGVGVIAELAGLIPAVSAALPTFGGSLAIEAGFVACNMAVNWAWSKANDTAKANLRFEVSCLVCDYDDDDDPDDPDDEEEDVDRNKKTCNCKKGSCKCRIKCLCKKKPPFPNTVPILDPSGYVFEAVPSNRLPGVTAAIYTQEEIENMFGETSVEEVLWNAEEFGQQNPLTTDELGLYAWDVPVGMWQVRFNKDGYADTQSEWLPVPPPQLEVNIPMVQTTAPTVKEAHAYETGIQMEFDKYMDMSTITNANVFVTVGGASVPGSVEAVNEECTDPFALPNDTETPRYASIFRFVPETPLSVSQGEATLTIRKEVKSYAGVPMDANFSQAFDIEKEITAIQTSDPVQVKLGESTTFVVDVAPFDAAVGKTLRVVNRAPSLLGVDAEEYVIDANGQAAIRLSGNLPGQGVLHFSIDGSWTEGSANIVIVDDYYEVLPPVASRMSGTAVYYGTQIRLSTDIPDATIYYTLDGTCPCDPNGSRMRYVNPIVANGDLNIQAMVVTLSGDESETAEFHYTIKQGATDYSLPEGWSWISHNMLPDVPVSTFTDREQVERVVSQTSEAVRAADGSVTGGLTALSSAESYKVHTLDALAGLRIADTARDPKRPISVTPGCNWIGYAPDQVMTLDEALSKTDAAVGDFMVGQTGFAQYDGEAWQGTLETLAPARGYMYFSNDSKSIVYNADIVSNAASIHSRPLPNTTPWVADIYRYPSAMCIVADILDKNGDRFNPADLSLGAFCDTECRGVGYVVGDRYFLSVYGNPGDEITFQASDADGKLHTLSSPVTFSETILGTIAEPHALVCSGLEGIEGVAADSPWKLSVDHRRLLIAGPDLRAIDEVALISIDGRRALTARSVTPAGLSLAALPAGVYGVALHADGRYYYFKIALK